MTRKYECDHCSKTNVKLWREYQTCADRTLLLCVDCTAKQSGKDVSEIDEKGRIPWENTRTYSIGWYVPAVPFEGVGFHGYCGIPEDRLLWWEGLPTR